MPIKIPITKDEIELEAARSKYAEVRDRELRRRSLDTIRVYNPLEHTFAFQFDKYWHRVPAKSEKDFARYLAMHFFKKIADYMIGQQISAKGNEILKIREKQLGTTYLDKYQENTEVWNKVPKMGDPILLGQIMDVVLLGVVDEYGMEEGDPEAVIPDAPIDPRSVYERVFDRVNTRLLRHGEAPAVTVDAPVAPQADDKELQNIAEQVMSGEMNDKPAPRPTAPASATLATTKEELKPLDAPSPIKAPIIANAGAKEVTI